MKKYLALILSLLLVFFLGQRNSIGEEMDGSIRGFVRDLETKSPLIGVNVVVQGTDFGAATDSSGRYTITGIPAGSYAIMFSYVGYQTRVKTDVIVRPARITSLEADLQVKAVEQQVVKVTADYFAPVASQPTSAVNFSNEEIRRTPGAAGDVSRIMMMLPSVAKINDQVNSLVVRGGSPVENGFYVDNIEIPNINHFPVQGTSSGSLGLLNVDFIQDVDFYSGGFAVEYGDKLSSVMDIKYRDGNRSEYDGQLDLGFAGFGGVAEGPVARGNGSWMISVRRSYLDLLLQLMNFSVTPMYADVQGKAVYKLNQRNSVSILDIFGMDRNTITKDQAKDQDVSVYGSDDHDENTIGANWRTLWSQSGYSQTSISQTQGLYRRKFSEYGTDNLILHLDSRETSYHLRNINHFRLTPRQSIEFGLESKYLHYNYHNLYGAYLDALGNPTPEIRADDLIRAVQVGLFVSYTFRPLVPVQLTLGVRADYFSLPERTPIEPRFSFTYHLTDRTSINGSTGLFVQNIPMNLLAQVANRNSLKAMRAVHYILGFEQLLSKDTRLLIETYRKVYWNFPMDPQQPSLFIIDEMFYRDGFYMGHSSLNNAGEADAYGVEVLLQKKLATNFYGVISASYFRARYRDLNGSWHPRVFDNRMLFNIEGGYRPNNRWEISGRWVFAGGRPYTPFNIPASTAANRAIFDSTKINGARYPAYHSLNIRVDRRFWFHSTNIVLYISLWNAYNQQNVAAYFWNKAENKRDIEYQWSLLPIFGFEYEF